MTISAEEPKEHENTNGWRFQTMEEETAIPAANEPKLDDEAQAHVPTPIWVRLKR